MPTFDYQDDGVKFLRTHPRALLTDEPGLGKTRQELLAMVPYAGNGVGWNCIVVAANHDQYRVGGPHLWVPHDQIRTGHQANLAAVQNPFNWRAIWHTGAEPAVLEHGDLVGLDAGEGQILVEYVDPATRPRPHRP